jgi:hypothetical protein
MTVPVTTPKPFVFVLMPFDPKFNDIYKFGIKGATEDVGAYAERLDEQIFVEGMLDRIFNQISRADVIVGDMTGRNPNVFYEVGYAHALGKITLLLTQDANDIPFDLKHRQHTVYSGSIDVLRKELAERLRWAIAESKRQARGAPSERLSVRLLDRDIPYAGTANDVPILAATVPARSFQLPLHILNDSYEALPGITHVYLFADENAGAVPCRREQAPFNWSNSLLVDYSATMKSVAIDGFKASSVDAPDGLSEEFRLDIAVASIPPRAVETALLDFMFREGSNSVDSQFRLRLHTPFQFHDFTFRMKLDYEAPRSTAEESKGASETN